MRMAGGQRNRTARRLLTRLFGLACLLVLIAVATAADPLEAPAQGEPTPRLRDLESRSRALERQLIQQTNRTRALETQIAERADALANELALQRRDIDDQRGDFNIYLTPVAILVGVLAVGGILGGLFSVRDERRATQLHALAVTGETSAQRRTEETYTSFFEASQKTLTLVNDTLQLAKEANERSAQEARRNAERQLDEFEDRAADLLQPIFNSQEFEAIITVPEERSKIERLGKELELIQGYFRLQDLEPKPHSQFVIGIAAYLGGRTSDALATIQRAARHASNDDLVRFSLYWAASLERNLGLYERAMDTFETARREVRDENDERIELDRSIAETEFFGVARTHADAAPADRYRAVQTLLESLVKLDSRAREPTESRAPAQSLIHEIADTRGHIYTWIAFDRVRLFATYDTRTQAAAPAESTPDPSRLDSLRAEVVRAWALKQAEAVYDAAGEIQHATDQEGADFEIAFGKTHCEFGLEEKTFSKDLATIENLAAEAPAVHREPRRAIEYRQTVLICRCWRHVRTAGTERAASAQGLDDARRGMILALEHLNDHEIELFSLMQRRNISQGEFKQEVNDLYKQAMEAPAPVPRSARRAWWRRRPQRNPE